jgi:hypothetical protein
MSVVRAVAVALAAGDRAEFVEFVAARVWHDSVLSVVRTSSVRLATDTAAEPHRRGGESHDSALCTRSIRPRRGTRPCSFRKYRGTTRP